MPIHVSEFFIVIFLLQKKKYANQIAGNQHLTLFQENVNSIKKFMKPELVDEDVVQMTIDHYDHVWKKSHGNRLENFCSELHPNLLKDFTYFLFGESLQKIELFEGAEESFFQMIGVHLQQVFVKKDEDIIRCNDIQDKIYIVYKGSVEINVANTSICVLKQGGIFGNITKHGKIRQTILGELLGYFHLIANLFGSL